MSELVRLTADGLDPADKIFDSLRADYPGFAAWLGKCARQKRVAWVVDRGEHRGVGRYGGVCIVHGNNEHGYSWKERSLKICCLKVGRQESDQGWAETFIRQAVAEAVRQRSVYAFTEVQPKHARLVALLMTFGFEPVTQSSKGEVVLRLRVIPLGQVP